MGTDTLIALFMKSPNGPRLFMLYEKDDPRPDEVLIIVSSVNKDNYLYKEIV